MWRQAMRSSRSCSPPRACWTVNREKSAAYVGVAERLIDTVPQERRPRFDLLLAVLRLVLARWRGDSRRRC